MNIGIALSGGGFRATLFQLGVLRFLYEAGLLKSVKAISAVSGGSVLAAHLVANWKQYCGDEADFAKAANELVRFAQSDVRGNIVRRVLLSFLLVVPRFLVTRPLRWTTTNLLQRYYDNLFSGRRLKDLNGADLPSIILNCTSLTTGQGCEFDSSGFAWYVLDEDTSLLRRRHISAPNTKISFAVACSSAFPPLFPPLIISSETLYCRAEQFPNPQYLTDGGVYDNLGIARLAAGLRDKQLDYVIVCDAEGDFDTEVDNAYTNLIDRNVRASDLLMTRVSALLLRLMDVNKDQVAHVSIKSETKVGRDQLSLDPEIERSLGKIRTDLDSFSDLEVEALIRHGYNCARAKLSQHSIAPLALKWSWRPRTLPVAASLHLQQIRSGNRRSARLWSSRDWVSWATASTVAAIAFIFYLPVLLSASSVVEAKREAAEAQRDAAEASSVALRLAKLEYAKTQPIDNPVGPQPPVPAPPEGGERPHFMGELKLEMLADGRQVKLLEPISFRDSSGVLWTAPAGVISDGLSLPPTLWSIIGPPLDKSYARIAILHDYYAERRVRSWQDTDRMFYEGLIASGVSEIKAKILYQTVYSFGPRWESKNGPP